MRMRRGIPTRCRKCSQDFPSIQALIRHDKEKHFGVFSSRMRADISYRINKLRKSKRGGEDGQT